jgi:uncharacterized membrane protein
MLFGVLWPYICTTSPPRTTVRSVLGMPLRMVILLLLASALSQPLLHLKSGTATLWVLVDRSASAASEVQPHLSEWETLIERNRPTSAQLKVLDVAEEVWPRMPGERQRTFGTNQTRIGSALRYVLGRSSDAGKHRILVITDGYATDPLEGVSNLITERGIPVDLRLTPQISQRDIRLNRLTIPSRVLPQEPFVIEFEVTGGLEGKVPYILFRDGKIIHQGLTNLDKGNAVVRVADMLPKGAQMHGYRVAIDPANDQFPENNTATGVAAVDGPPAVLVLSSFEDDPIVRVLEEAGIKTHHPPPSANLDATTLGSINAVILNNIHASSLSSEFLSMLKFFVETQGGGLIMVGGHQSFGTGGYFGTAIDTILPVSVELQEEQRKLSVAFSFVLDRSGSMTAAVEGNLGNLTKMDLANEGTARAISLLSNQDEAGIIAVDSAATIVVPLKEIGSNENLDLIVRKARSINVGGGGIFVFEGLQNAWKELEASTKVIRHIILFADAADAEEPGNYKELLKTITAAGGSVSVIALGNRTDQDAKLLEEIASLGEGRAFFVNNAVDLPAVFSQETVAVARAQYVNKKTPLTFTDSWPAIAKDTIKLPPFVDGYNRTYLRPEASSALVSLDEDKVPLLASWQKGLGRVIAIPFPLAGEHASTVRQWSQYSAFVRTVLQWVRRPQVPAGLSLMEERVGNTAQIVLRYASEWETEIGIKAPEAVIVSSQSKEPEEIPWSRVGPGRFTLTRELSPGEVIHGAASIGKYTIPFGPVANPRSPEYDFDPEQYRALKQLSRLSGGQERISFDGIWDDSGEYVWYSLQMWCIALALVLLLVEVLLSRLNRGSIIELTAIPIRLQRSVSWRVYADWRIGKRHNKVLSRRGKETFSDRTPHDSDDQIRSGESSPAVPPNKEKMTSAFEKAKRRGV